MEGSMMGEDVDPSVEFLYKTMCKVIFILAETTLMFVDLLNLLGEKKGGGELWASLTLTLSAQQLQILPPL
jgi:hypothetical protein